MRSSDDSETCKGASSGGSDKSIGCDLSTLVD